MKTNLIAAILSATAAFAAATWVYLPEEPRPVAAAGSTFDTDLPATERLAALEQAVSQEQSARQLLQEEVMFLTEELDLLRAAAPVPEARAESSAEENTSSAFERRRERYARRNSPEARAARLVEGGIDVGLADWIVQREQELQMDSLQARFEASRNGDPVDYYRDRYAGSEVLREELGDPDYERYLEANGRSTSVGVSSVIGSSPAQAAGLKPGDEIIRYDGSRVFSMSDITAATMTGEPGQTIVVDVLRDGLTMQVVLPRGPLGITAGRTRR